MKARSPYLPLFPLLATGMMLLPMTLQAQDAPRESAPGAAPQAAPNPEQIQAMVRELQELHRAGKREEARPLIQRLRTLAKENPQLAETLHNAMKPQEQPMAQPNPAAPAQPQMRHHMPGGQEQPMAQQNPTAPAPPQMRPHMPGGQGRPMAQQNPTAPAPPQMRPHMPGGQERPMAQQNPTAPAPPQMRPHMPGGQEQPMAQLNMPGQQPPQAQQNRFGWQGNPMLPSPRQGAWGPRMAQHNMPGQQLPQAQQNRFGWQGNPMFQSHRQGNPMFQSHRHGNPMFQSHRQGNPMFQSHRHGGWGSRMEPSNAAGNQRHMGRKNMLGWQGGQLSRSHRHGGWGPRMVQPNAAGSQRQMLQPKMAQPQRPMARPNLAAGQAQPPVQADQSQVAKLRHLRQAAEHLAAAGFAEQAAKAREESARMEKELNQRKAQAPADMSAAREAPRRDHNQDNKVKPEAGRVPDPNAAMLNEMRKLGKQIEQLNSRMQKLETRGAE